MTATDRIRAAARDDAHPWWENAEASSDLEALCDLADAARYYRHAKRWLDGANPIDDDTAHTVERYHLAEAELDAALARLDGEDG